MKLLMLMLWLIVFFTLAVSPVHACRCAKITGPIVPDENAPKPDPEAVKKWRQEQTEIALFIGSVRRIEKFKVKHLQWPNERFPMKKVTVTVEKYWLGVKSPEIIIYTGVGGGDCGVSYVKGKQYLFLASRQFSSGLLETNICGPSNANHELVDRFNEVFGNAKEFAVIEREE